MGCELVSVSASHAYFPVTLTVGARPTYGLVMFLNFAYSCRAGQFDTDGSFFQWEERGLVTTGLAPPFLCAGFRRRKKGAGFFII
jgi:hypothetical protein